MSLSATLFGRDSAIHRLTNIMGLGIPGWLDKKFGPPETEGPRLSDLSVQTSTYGADIPRLYGTISVMGNVIQLENNKLKETVRKKKSGGKGGGGASEPTKTYSYSATFQLALCEGPIAGIRRMWCGDKLIYNAGSDDLETIIASNQAATGWKLYLGTDDQMPDPRYEAEYGVGNVSAHRGLAYIAFYDFKLADYSNTLQGAQFKVEVMSASLTSEAFLYSYVGAVPSHSLASPRPSNAYSTDLESYFSTFGGGVNGGGGLHRFNRNGIRTEINYSAEVSPVAPTETFRPDQTLSSDTVQGWFYQNSGDEDHIYIRQSGSTKYYQSTLAAQPNKALVERSGNFWMRYGPSGSYLLSTLSFSEGGDTLDGQIVAGASIAITPIYCLAGMADGRIATCTFFMSDGSTSATVNITVLDESLATTQSDSFSISRPANTTAHEFSSSSSFAYCSDDGVMHICFKQDYDASEIVDGRFFYFSFDTGRRVVVSSLKAMYHPTSATFEPRLVSVKDGVMQVADAFGASLDCALVSYAVSIQGNQLTPLASIISGEISFSGLIGDSDVDVSGIDSGVRGYRISGGSIRSSMEPLRASFPFDIRASGYQIEFIPRGQASVATIPWEDLGATSGDTPDDIFQQSREMDTQLPAKTVVKYLDAAREYAIGEQFSERLNTEAVNKVERDLAIVLTANEAAGIAEMLNFLPWLERTPASFTLPPPYRYLEAGDVVTVASQAAKYEIRLTEANETQDGRLECQAVQNRAALYAPAATGSEGVPPSGIVPLAGVSLFVPLDIPVIDETLQNAPGFVGVMTGYTNGWPGGLAVRSVDDGQTWADLQAYAGRATIGVARGTLPSSTCALIDQRTLTVDLISGELDSVTRDQMLAGVNYAAYGLDGRWEIVRFQNAALQADGSYVLSGFVRGEKGTEWTTGLHAAADYFILLDDPDNAFIGMAVGSIAVPATYRAITSGASVDDATDVPFTYQGVNLECLSPVYASGVRDGSSNFTGTFTRRSRLSSSWWATGVAAPVGEASEAYEIDVMDGLTVARTITASTPAFAYSAADQTTDFGSAQASITFRIFQLSATVGRGYPLEVIL